MKRRPRFIFLTLAVATIIMVSGFLLDKNQSTTASDQPSTDISLGVEQSQEVVIRFFYDTQEQLNAVASQLDIWEVHPSGIEPSSGYAVAAVFPAQQAWLDVLGYRLEIDQKKTDELQAPSAVLDPRYYYFDDFNNNSYSRYIVDFMQEMSATYPALTELIDIGDAWLASHSGYHRDMWVLRITNEDPQYGEIASKPPFFMMANIHAREVTTPEMAIRYIKYLTTGYNGAGGYGDDPDVTWLVNHHVVYVLVSQNPDGHVINEANWSAYWRKNVDNDDGCSIDFGVDLNRNSSFKWGCCGGSSGQCNSETYRGPNRASEPETAALQTFATQVFADWNGNNGDDEIPQAAPDNTVGIFISLHSYQDQILWAWEFTSGPAPNEAQLYKIGSKLADITDIMLPTGFLYTVDGGTIDWMYGKLGIPAYTYEIGPTYGSCGDFFPPYGCQDGIDGMPRDFWAEMGPSFVYANKIAGSPYKTSYGPDTKSLLVNPTTVPAGVPAILSGTVLDQRYAGDPLVPVTAAEYFIDAPGVDGTGTSLSPTDGVWGSTTEAVEGAVDTTGLLEGQHYILVHGMNQNGFWGPFTAVFLYITTPAYGVMLTPETDSTQSDPGIIVTYSLQVNNVGLNNDIYDISVDSLWESTAPSEIGPILAGDSTTFDVQVTIPLDANNGETDIATVTVSSQTDSNIQDSSELTTTANLYKLSLSPSTDEGSGNPGEQVGYTLHLTNLGNTADSYDLNSTSIWMVTVTASAGPLEPETSVDIDVLVDVPLGAAPGDADVATITATSQGNNAANMSSTLTTSVTAMFSFQAVPVEDTLVGHGRGTNVEFTILVTNTGNITDSYDILIEPNPNGWPVDAPEEVGPLADGERTTVTITVHVPFEIAMGDHNDTVLRFISQGAHRGHEITLHTDTVWYSNFLPLSQRH